MPAPVKDVYICLQFFCSFLSLKRFLYKYYIGLSVFEYDQRLYFFSDFGLKYFGLNTNEVSYQWQLHAVFVMAMIKTVGFGIKNPDKVHKNLSNRRKPHEYK